MATSSSSSSSTSSYTFEKVMETFVKEVIELGRSKRGIVLGRKARERLGTEVLRDRRNAIAKALERLSDYIANTKGSDASIKSEEAASTVLDAGLVNILFCCLPKPEAFERSLLGTNETREKYDGFQEFILYLFTVIGRKELEDFCDDPLLGGLFATADRAAASSAPHAKWKDELRRLAWETRGRTQDSTRSPLTVRILEYLCWDVQGRKDKFCNVQKPTVAVDLETLRRTAQQDLSRLPQNGLTRNCAYCSAPGAEIACDLCFPEEEGNQAIGTAYCGPACGGADVTTHALICEQTRNLSRRALIFQITFVQYLVSINFGTTFIVSEQDGVVHLSLSNAPARHPTTGSHYVGVSPDLDLSLPSVETALHGFHCCDIKTKTRALLEYFLGGTCDLITFIDFVPKNAHTPLEVERDESFRFNMSALHTVALLTTRSGRNFILDPTAAQFGWKEYLAPWETYDPCRIEFLQLSEVRKVHGRPRTPTEHTLRPRSEAGRKNWTSKVVAENILEIAEATFMEKGGLDRILQLPRVKFEELCSEFKENLKSEMRYRDKMRIDSQYQGA